MSSLDNLPVQPGLWEQFYSRGDVPPGVFSTSRLHLLDRPLELAKLRDAVARVLPCLPASFGYFRDGGLCPPSAETVLVCHDAWEGEPADFMTQVVGRPVDLAKALFEIHYAGGNSPLLGIRVSHVAGDGVSLDLVLAALSAAYENEPCNLIPANASTDDAVIAYLRSFPVRPLVDLRRQVVPGWPSPESPAEITTACLELNGEAFRRFEVRRRGFGVSSLSVAAASLAMALHRSFPEWAEEKGDFLVVSIPMNLRPALSESKLIGNLAWPLSLPFLAEELENPARAMATAVERSAWAKDNYLPHHRLIQSLRKPSVGADRISPMSLAVVTELPQNPSLARFGDAKILDYWARSPSFVRRVQAGRMKLYVNVPRHPLLNDAVKVFLAAFSDHYLGEGEWIWSFY